VVGLFVFAVKAEEFRDGRRIGESRRDFQMLVLDCPDPGVKPELKVEVPPSDLNEGGIFTEELTVEFTNEDDRCVTFLITDQDGSETVEIESVAVNFEDNEGSIFSVTSGFLQDANSVLEVEVCFQECPPLQDIPFIIDFIASDDACPLPLKDTLMMNVIVEAPDNTAPELKSSNNALLDSIVTMFIGDTLDLGLTGTDIDGDSITLYLAEVDSITRSLGFTFNPVSGINEINSGFFWEASCEDLAIIDTLDLIHEFTFVVQDNAKCNPKTDTVVIHTRLQDLVFEVNPDDIANIFTPNGDGVNETWGLGEFFPEDNCEDEFLNVIIVNRWGRPVFESNNRNFEWDGEGSATGVYFYHLKFRNSDYSGPLTLMR
jgi:gliding motility-associated-like protein